jgi:hypothetical protein
LHQLGRSTFGATTMLRTLAIAEYGVACRLPGWSTATSFCALDAWNEVLVAGERSFNWPSRH